MRILIILIIILLFLCPNTYAINFTNDANCQAAWLFEEGTGTTVADSSQNSNTGTFKASGEPAWSTSVPSFNVSGSSDGSADFDGTDDYISISGLLGNASTATIIGWCNLTTADTSGATFLSLGDYLGIVLDKAAGTTGFYYNGGAWINTASGNDYAGDGWHLFTYVCDPSNSTQKLYIDGATQIASTTAGTAISYSGKGSNTYFGKHAYGNTGFDFDGLISETAFFDRVLSTTEINAIYDYGLEGQSTSTTYTPKIIMY